MVKQLNGQTAIWAFPERFRKVKFQNTNKPTIM